MPDGIGGMGRMLGYAPNISWLLPGLALTEPLRAKAMSGQKVLRPAGVELPEIGRQRQHDLVVENLLYAAPLAALSKVLLTIEVLNPLDNPGYFLTSSQEAVEIVRQVDHPTGRFQFATS